MAAVLLWSTAGTADVTAVALYAHYWTAFSAVPQWVLAGIPLVAVLGLNLLAVKVFGEMEFRLALIKVVALTAFLVIGTLVLAFALRLHAGGASATIRERGGRAAPAA